MDEPTDDPRRRGRARTPESVEAAAVALAGGATVEQAAAACGVSFDTLRRWRRNPKFRARVAQLRDQATAEAVGRLASACSASADKLRKLVDSTDEKVSLQASKAVLEMTLKTREALEITERLEALERQLAAQNK